jgi:hypothetical protein
MNLTSCADSVTALNSETGKRGFMAEEPVNGMVKNSTSCAPTAIILTLQRFHLAWDTITLFGYFLLNCFIVGYLLNSLFYKKDRPSDPGFTPDTLGQVYVYRPSITEIKIATAIFAIGFLIFTLVTKIAIAINFEGFTIDSLKKKKAATQ